MDVSRFKNKYMGSHRKLYCVAYRLLESEADAQDVVQETYAKLWARREELETVENGEAYAMMILKNQCIDLLRVRVVRFSESVDEIDYRLSIDEESTQDVLENKELLNEVKRVLLTLPDQQQQVMRLRHWGDLSIEEIEVATGLTSANVRVLLSRGRKKVKEILRIK